MPQKNAPPGAKKKKKGRAPAHQNAFAFKHNPKSKLTDKILSSPNVGVCKRCHDKIEWRKKYRKYKPLTQPKKCNKCDRRNIKAAYHTVCNDCSFVLVTVPTKPSQDPTMDDSSTTTSDTNPPNPQTADITKTKRVRMCSVCFKEPIMSKSEEERKEEECKQLEEELTQEVVASSGSDRLSLREKKSIERKIQQHMNTGKGDRVKNEHHDDDNDEEDVSEEDSQLSHDSEGLEEDVANVEIHDQDKSNKDDEDDPFLKAIGGKDKMLVGEAYQKMLLAKNASNTN